MNAPPKSPKFDWLIVDDAHPGVITPDKTNTSWMPFPIPPELGQGGGYGVELALGMTIFRGKHQFKPTAAGQLIPLAQIKMAFPEKTFVAEIARGGQLMYRSVYPDGEFLSKPGLDVFRMTDGLELTVILDGSTNVEGTSLSVGWSAMCQLLGEQDSAHIQTRLGLDNWPKTCVVSIPLHVSAHLHNAVPSALVGPIKALHCQARVLDYFDALIDFLHAGETAPPINGPSKERARAVQEFLLQSEGKLPKLDELGRQFSYSARRLNEEFIAEYGQSIYTFITNHRLDVAHAAIHSSDVPMKKLAEKLGYAHFNHFSAAFKRRFGYPPGSLRKA